MNEMTWLDQALVSLFDSPGYHLVAVLAALGIGAAHAVAPGHGKAVTAAYLVGSRGTYRHAAALGGVVALMHTFSAIVLAVAWVSVSAVASIGTPAITAVLQALAGLLIIGVGVQLIRRRRRRAHDLEHHHDHPHVHAHDHHHDHHHDHPHVHAHDSHGHPDKHPHPRSDGPDHAASENRGQTTVLAADQHQEAHARAHARQVEAVGNPFSRRGLVALGLSGGLVPSPSSFLVLVSGMLTGQVVFALVLVGVFGIGMACTLTLVGVVTLRGTAVIQRSSRSSAVGAVAARWIPVAAAYAVVFGGLVYLTIAIRALV